MYSKILWIVSKVFYEKKSQKNLDEKLSQNALKMKELEFQMSEIEKKIESIKLESNKTRINEKVTKAEIEKLYQQTLKLYEEYKEVIEANGDERIEELADMLEVIRALACLENKNLNDIIEKADKKSEKRGAFNQKIFLEKVIESKENS